MAFLTCLSFSFIVMDALTCKNDIPESNRVFLHHSPCPYLQILPFNELIKFSKCMLMHSIHYNYNQNFTNVWTQNNQRNHDINLRNDDDYYLPQVNKEFFRRSTLYSIPNTWNALGDIKFQQNRTTFKINLLYDLFESLTD
jgi:hypothetical protein